MKLYELLRESNIKQIQVKRLPTMERNPKIGSGVEAKVYADKSGGTVIKELPIENSIEINATYQYINMVMEHQDNPFFPRIYSAKLYTAKSGGKEHSKLIIQMEKLTEFDTSKTEHLLPQLIEQFGINPEDIGNVEDSELKKNMKSYMKNLKSGNHWQEDKFNRNMVLSFIGSRLYEMFKTRNGRKQLIKNSSNPQLKEAIKLTDEIIFKTGGEIDINANNVMVRLTGHGPQLVITDPVASYK